MAMVVDMNLLAQLSFEGMAECLIEGSILTAIAVLVLRTVRVRNAAARFLVWMSVLALTAALPIATAVWRASGTSIAVSTPHSAAINLPALWATWAFAAWAGIALVGIARLALGLWQLYRLRQDCVELQPEDVSTEIANVLAEHHVRLCVSTRLRSPAAIGFFRLAVVLPDGLAQELSPAQLRQVVEHELEHLRRCDHWTNLAQRFVTALLFFHPLVWWIAGKLALEREMACDDAVLARRGDARAYAECLVRLAERGVLRRGLALAQAAVSRLRHTSMRVAQILDGRPRTAHLSPALLPVFGLLIVTCVGVAWRAPVLIGFRDNVSAQPAAYAGNRAEQLVHNAVFVPSSASTSQPRKAVADIRVAKRNRPAKAPVQSLMARVKRPANPQPALVPAETLVVFVSAPAPGLPLIQVQMWRITVLQLPVQAEKVPRKVI